MVKLENQKIKPTKQQKTAFSYTKEIYKSFKSMNRSFERGSFRYNENKFDSEDEYIEDKFTLIKKQINFLSNSGFLFLLVDNVDQLTVETKKHYNLLNSLFLKIVASKGKDLTVEQNKVVEFYKNVLEYILRQNPYLARGFRIIYQFK